MDEADCGAVFINGRFRFSDLPIFRFPVFVFYVFRITIIFGPDVITPLITIFLKPMRSMYPTHVIKL